MVVFSVGSVSGKAALPGVVQAVSAGLANGLAASFVLVIGSHRAHAPVQSDRVVVHPGDIEFGTQGGGVSDREQVTGTRSPGLAV